MNVDENALKSLTSCLFDFSPITIVLNRRILLALIHQVQLAAFVPGNDGLYRDWANSTLAELANLYFGETKAMPLVLSGWVPGSELLVAEPIIQDGEVYLRFAHPRVAPEEGQASASEIEIRPLKPSQAAPRAHLPCPFEPRCPFREPRGDSPGCNCP